MTIVDVLANATSATVTAGGTDAPAALTPEVLTVTTNTPWPILGASQVMRVMDLAQLDPELLSGYEIMELTVTHNGTGVTFSVTRGVEGTTPTIHLADWTMVPVATAGGLDGRYQQRTEIVQTLTGVTGPQLIDAQVADAFDVSMVGNTTFSFANFSVGTFRKMVLRGAFIPTWPSIAWAPYVPLYQDLGSGMPLNFGCTSPGEIRGEGLAPIAPNIFDAYGSAAAEQTRALAAEAALEIALVRTAVVGSNTAAGANQLIPVDTTANAVTIQLPTNPADKTRVFVKLATLGAGNFVTVLAGTGGAFDKVGGGTSSTLQLANQGKLFQFDAGSLTWTTIDSLPRTQVVNAGPPTACNLTSDVTLGTSATTDVLDTPSLAVGTYLVIGALLITEGGGVGSIEVELTVKTATATIIGLQSGEWETNAAVLYGSVPIAAFVTVTVAGTLKVQAFNNSPSNTGKVKQNTNSTATYPNASGILVIPWSL